MELDRPSEDKNSEKKVGILRYNSKSSGIGGAIKGEPKDFDVEEITPEGIVLEIGKNQQFEDLPGDYTHFTLEKLNWDTIRAVKAISSKCGTSHSRFKYAGTKDRRSLSAQRVSAWKIPREKLEKIKIKDITLRDFSTAPEPVNLGCLAGNRFKIIITGAAKDAPEKVRKIVSELNGTYPNYYGMQRFGSRLNNHKIGEHFMKGRFKEAVMAYLCETGGEPAEAGEARKRLAETQDFKAAFKEFPAYLGYEKSILNCLIKEPNDYIGAFRELPKKLRLMFVHATQGYIFNLALSEYLERDSERVPKELPLVGYTTKPDEVTLQILKTQDLKTEDFKIASMPEMSLEGDNREAMVKFKEFEIVDFNATDCNLTVRFSLPAGAYATMLLRELMK